jgi:hypothetical protein
MEFMDNSLDKIWDVFLVSAFTLTLPWDYSYPLLTDLTRKTNKQKKQDKNR